MKPERLPTPSEMIAYLDRHVHAQTRAKQDLAVAVYNHYLSQAYRVRGGPDLGRHHILLLGPTGVGKTYLVKTLTEFLGVPVGFASAAGLVEAGYKGNSVETLITSLLERAGGNPRQAERGVVFVDEIDKVKRGDTGGGRDISGEGVQNALLTLLDGRISRGNEGDSHRGVDTSRLLFVCSGAFVGLGDIVQKRLGRGRSRLGFSVAGVEGDGPAEVPARDPELGAVQTVDLVEFGMIPEFIGRFATITALQELDHDALRAILSEGITHSALERQRDLARIHGIELEITAEALDTIAEEAEALGTGARGLQRLIGIAVDSVDSRWSELAAAGVNRVVIGRSTLIEGQAPLLEKGPALHTSIADELRTLSLAGLPRRPSVTDLKPEAGDSGEVLSAEELATDIQRMEQESLGLKSASSAAESWWAAFRASNSEEMQVVHLLCKVLVLREASIDQFFDAHLYSNTDNLQANLYYLDYMLAKQAADEGPDEAS